MKVANKHSERTSKIQLINGLIQGVDVTQQLDNQIRAGKYPNQGAKPRGDIEVRELLVEIAEHKARLGKILTEMYPLVPNDIKTSQQ